MDKEKETIEDKAEDRAEYASDRLDKRAIDLVESNKDESLTYYSDRFKEFQRFDYLYKKGSAKKNVQIGRANLELAQAFQQIEPFVSKLGEMMVGEAPYIKYVGKTLADEAPAELITDFTQSQLDSGDFLKAWNQYTRNLGKHGTAVMKVVWDTDKEIIESEKEVTKLGIDPLTGEVIEERVMEKVEEPITIHDGPSFLPISIYDFFVPASATSCNIQKLDWCIHRTYRDIDTLLSNPNYKNKDKLKQCYEDDENGKEKSEPSFRGNDQYKRQDLEMKNGSSDKYKGKIEVLERWGYFKFKDDGEYEKALITICYPEGGEAVCLRLERNPFKYKFKPFIASNDYPVEGEFYGLGELHHIKSLIDEETALRNATLDMVNQALNPMWLVERQSGVNLRELHSAPNKIVLTNDRSGISRLDNNVNIGNAAEQIARISFDIQNTTEIVNPRQDASNMGAAFGGTATGVNFLSGRTNLRMLTKARLQENDFFRPLAQMLLMYNRDMITDEVYFRVTDKEENPYSLLTPDAFASQIDFKGTAGPSKYTKEELKANIGYTLQTVAQVEKVAPGTNNFYKLMPDVYRAAGFSHPEQYVNPPQTTVGALPNGQFVDKQGNPVNVIPLDEQGQPLPQGQPGQEQMGPDGLPPQ